MTHESVPPIEIRVTGYKELAWTLTGALILAFVGFGLTYVEDRRKDELTRVNAQIDKLYGPLYSYSVATQKAHEMVHKTYKPQKSVHFFDDPNELVPEQVEGWRRWIKTVLLPLDQKMENAITDNAQLLDGDRMYPLFSKLIAHVESLKATVAKWKDTDDLKDIKYRSSMENDALIKYPVDVDSCIEERLHAAYALREKIEQSLVYLHHAEPDPKQFPEECS